MTKCKHMEVSGNVSCGLCAQEKSEAEAVLALSLSADISQMRKLKGDSFVKDILVKEFPSLFKKN